MSAVASDIRAEILGANTGLKIPVDTAPRHFMPSDIIIAGVFAQTMPPATDWDGIHRGSVCWFQIIVANWFIYEPPM